jgi:hypothetical protein
MDSPGPQDVAAVLGAKATEQQLAAEASRLRREERKAAMAHEPEPEAAPAAPAEVDLLGSFPPSPAAADSFLLGDFASPVASPAPTRPKEARRHARAQRRCKLVEAAARRRTSKRRRRRL